MPRRLYVAHRTRAVAPIGGQDWNLCSRRRRISLPVKYLAVWNTIVAATTPAGLRKQAAIAVTAFVALLAMACSGGTEDEIDDGALWTIDSAVSVGFEKTEQLKPGPAKVFDAWAGAYNGARVELYRHRVTELGVGIPVDPTWLHRRTLADDCCNFWQRNRLTAICALEEQACKELREALEAAFPL